MEIVAFLLIGADSFSPFVADLRMCIITRLVFVSACTLHEILAPGGLLLFLMISTRGLTADRSWFGGMKAGSR